MGVISTVRLFRLSPQLLWPPLLLACLGRGCADVLAMQLAPVIVHLLLLLLLQRRWRRGVSMGVISMVRLFRLSLGRGCADVLVMQLAPVIVHLLLLVLLHQSAVFVEPKRWVSTGAALLVAARTHPTRAVSCALKRIRLELFVALATPRVTSEPAGSNRVSQLVLNHKA